MTTGARIKAARKAAGMTQAELAAKLGISFQSVAQWENDLRNPKYETLQKIASALGVDIAELLGVKPAHAVDPNETPEDKEKRLGMREGALSNAPRAEDVEAQNKADMLEAMDKLNIPGQQEAVKRVQEMADIERYKRRSLSDIWGFGKDGKPPK